MRKATLFLAVCVVAVLAFRVRADVAATASKASATPVTIVCLIKNFDEKGNPAPSEMMLRAYRSDGSVAQHLISTTGKPPIRFVRNYEQRVQASIDPLIKAMIKHPVSGNPRIPATCESAWGTGNCLGSVIEKIEGFDLQKVTQAEQDAFLNEFLVAPALDYRPLRRTVMRSGSLAQEWIAMDVRSGEPEPGLFQIPDDYEIVTRDVFYQRGMEARSMTPNPNTIDRFRRIEQGIQPPPGCGK